VTDFVSWSTQFVWHLFIYSHEVWSWCRSLFHKTGGKFSLEATWRVLLALSFKLDSRCMIRLVSAICAIISDLGWSSNFFENARIFAEYWQVAQWLESTVILEYFIWISRGTRLQTWCFVEPKNTIRDHFNTEKVPPEPRSMPELNLTCLCCVIYVSH